MLSSFWPSLPFFLAWTSSQPPEVRNLAGKNYGRLAKAVNVNSSPAATSPAAGFVANNKYVFTFTPDPTLPSVTYNFLQSYASESLVLKRIFAASTPAPDGFVTFKVDGIEQNIVLGPMSQTLPSLQHPVVYENVLTADPNAKLEMYYVPLTATTVVTTITLNISYARVPKGYTGPI